MPGGDRNAYEQIRPIWEAIAAKVDDGACVTYIDQEAQATSSRWCITELSTEICS